MNDTGRCEKLIDAMGLSDGKKKGVYTSPNNVRTIAFSDDCVIIQWYSSKGQTGINKKVVFTESQMRADVQKAQSGKYKGILHALTGSRVCSCVEEIIFFEGNNALPEEVRVIDKDFIRALIRGKGEAGLRNSFPRLNSIIQYSCKGDKVAEAFMIRGKSDNEHKYMYELIEDIMDKSVKKSIMYSRVGDEWWRGSFLRPSMYSMDSPDGPIARKINSIRNYYEAMEKENKIERVYIEGIKREASNKVLRLAIESIDKWFKERDKLFENVCVQDRVTLLGCLEDKSIAKVMEVKECEGVEVSLKYIREYCELDSNIVDSVAGVLSKLGMKSVRGKVDIKDVSNNIRRLSNIICGIAVNLIGCEYGVIVNYIMLSGFEAGINNSVDKVGKSIQKYGINKLSIVANDFKVINKVTGNEGYRKYLGKITENIGGTNHIKSGNIMWSVINDITTNKNDK